MMDDGWWVMRKLVRVLRRYLVPFDAACRAVPCRSEGIGATTRTHRDLCEVIREVGHDWNVVRALMFINAPRFLRGIDRSQVVNAPVPWTSAAPAVVAASHREEDEDWDNVTRGFHN